MALLRQHEFSRAPDTFDRWMAGWRDAFRYPTGWWPQDMESLLRVDEYQDDGALVVRVEMAGIDPEKDVDITVSDGTLHIRAERQEEEKKTEDKNFVRKELRYGAFARDLALPEGCSADDVKATYKDGMLEIRIPMPKAQTSPPATKIAVTRS